MNIASISTRQFSLLLRALFMLQLTQAQLIHLFGTTNTEDLWKIVDAENLTAYERKPLGRQLQPTIYRDSLPKNLKEVLKGYEAQGYIYVTTLNQQCNVTGTGALE